MLRRKKCLYDFFVTNTLLRRKKELNNNFPIGENCETDFQYFWVAYSIQKIF
jgi:hypothetical protein